MSEHERGRPIPGTRHHEHRRRRKVRQRAADRNVDEEQAERCVLQGRARIEIVELAGEEQSADRHRRRLGYERPENRTNDQDRDPPRAGRPASGVSDATQGILRERHDRSRRRQRHDDDDEQGLGVIDLVVEVMLGVLPAVIREHRREQHDRPEAEHDFDFAEKVQEFGGHARRAASALGVGARILVMLNAIREGSNTRGGKRVQNCADKDRRGNAVEGIGMQAFRQDIENRPTVHLATLTSTPDPCT